MSLPASMEMYIIPAGKFLDIWVLHPNSGRRSRKVTLHPLISNSKPLQACWPLSGTSEPLLEEGEELRDVHFGCAPTLLQGCR